MSKPLSAMLESTSRLDPERFRIGDRAPRAALRPGSTEELGEILRAAARDRLPVVPWGGGVSLPRERPPERYDLALDLSALNRVIEYEPEDFTLTAECGVTLTTLRATLAARGHELPLEGAHADRATLGGVLAANASGPRRLRFGAPRHRILGARMALADGTVTRSGGKVVKNVAGYGLHRLLCGSRGGLGLILEASLKLAPAPAARVVLVYGATREQMADATRWERFPRLEPALLSVVGSAAAGALPAPPAPGAFTVVVGLEDDSAWVESQAAVVAEALGSPVAQVEGAEALRLWQALADLEEQDGPRLSFATAHNTPAALALLSTASIDPEGRAVTERLVFHAPAGRLHVFPESHQAQRLVRALAERGFMLIGERGIPVEPAVPAQVALGSLRARIRAALDPERLLVFGDSWELGRA